MPRLRPARMIERSGKRCWPHFDVQGHRGARGLRPENTLAGFAYAIDLGVTTLELDVGISADGVVVVCHDPLINPGLCLDANGQRLSPDARLYLKELTLQEIQSFDCGSLNPEPTRFPQQQPVPGATIPTLQQVFDLAEACNPAIRYNIESKVSPLHPEATVGPTEFATKLVALIEQNRLVDRAMIQSFDWRVLAAVKSLNSTIVTVALVLHTSDTSTIQTIAGPSPFLAGWNFDEFQGDLTALLKATGFVDVYSPNFETLLPGSPAFLQSVADVQRSGFAVIPWTVNDRAVMAQLITLDVNGLITDFPDVLLDVLGKQ